MNGKGLKGTIVHNSPETRPRKNSNDNVRMNQASNIAYIHTFNLLIKTIKHTVAL